MMPLKDSPLYRDSIAWQKSMELTSLVYALTRKFPSEERFGLTNQLRRAAVSIPSNIAEGKGRISKGELMQFVGIARGSILEVQTQLEIALMQSFGDELDLRKAHALASEVLRILNASLTTMRANAALKGKRS
jgi:four helix bundle protein